MKKYSLATSTLAEPLINNWYAWAHILPPVTASQFLVNYQLPIMQSYLQKPEFHEKAVKNPQMLGGPFMDFSSRRTNEVRQLLLKNKTYLQPLLDLAQAIKEFEKLLITEGIGQSLEPYYQKIPVPLQGYVELVYDHRNRPSLRFLEGLLYKSPYYDTSLQSLSISRTDQDFRPFFMTTPRFADDSTLSWEIPFASEVVDEFFKLDVKPQPIEFIQELLNVDNEQKDRILPLLRETDAVSERQPWREEGIRIRYFGHACVLIEWSGHSILIDPFIAPQHLNQTIDRFSYDDLPPTIDYVLITHNHPDHLVAESLLRLRHRIHTIVVPHTLGVFCADFSLKLYLQQLGFKNIIELAELESISLGKDAIIGVPFIGEHCDLAIGSKIGYLVQAAGKKILFAADSNFLMPEMYLHLRRKVGTIDTVFLGMECVGAPLLWLYGAFLPEKPKPEHSQARKLNGCDAERARALLKAVGANRVYIYAMGLEPWLVHITVMELSNNSVQMREAKALLKICQEEGFVDIDLLRGKKELYL